MNLCDQRWSGTENLICVRKKELIDEHIVRVVHRYVGATSPKGNDDCLQSPTTILAH